MFNLPWYSWFNVLALPILCVVLVVGMSMAGQAPWLKQLFKVQMLVAAAVVFMYWNAALLGSFLPLNYAFLLSTTVLAVYVVGGAVWDLLVVTIAWLRNKSKHAKAPVTSTAVQQQTHSDTQGISDVDGIVDLDAGQCSDVERDRQMGEAISSLFRKSSDSEPSSLVKFAKAIEEEADEEDDFFTVVGVLIFTFVSAVVVLPPLYMSFKLAQFF